MTKKKTKKGSTNAKQTVAEINIDRINQKSGWSKSFWKKNWPGVIVLSVLTFILYAQSISYGYVLDDRIVITENEYTKNGFRGIPDILTTESFKGYFGEQKDLVTGARYRPLSIITFAAEYGFFNSLKPGFSHFINILLYAICTIFLYRVLLLLIPTDPEKTWWLQLAFLASILWVAHPVHSEAVANIKGRDEILSLLFSLVSLLYALKYLQRERLLYLAAAALSLFLGLLSKEGAITFLGIIPLSIYFFSKAKAKQHIYILGSLLVGAMSYLLIRYSVIGYLLNSGKVITDLMNNPFYGMSGGEKSATIMYTLYEYFRLSFFPLTLTHDYYPFHIPTSNWGHGKVLLSLILHSLLAFLAIWGWKKKKLLSYSIWFYALAISIASNVLFPVGTFMNERFIFSASIGACIALGWILTKYLPGLSGQRFKPVFYGILLIWVTFFSVRTLIRVPVWESALSLNSSAVKVSVNSARANCFMGIALFNKYKETTDPNEKASLLDEAEFYINKSAELFPAYNNANLMIVGVAAEKYKVHNDLNRLLIEFKRVIKYRPETTFIHQYLEFLNERNADQRMIDFYLEASRIIDVSVPNSAGWRVKYLQYAYSIDPNNREINIELGNLFAQAGNSKQADFHYSKAGIRK